MITRSAFYLTISAIKMFLRNRQALFFTMFFPIVIMSIFGIIDFGGAGTTSLGIVYPEELREQIEPIVEGFKESDSLEVTVGNSIDDEKKEVEDDNRDLVLEFEQMQADVSRFKQIASNSSETVQPIKVTAYTNTASAQTAQFALLAIKQSFSEATIQASGMPAMFEVEEQEINVHKLTQFDFLLPGVIGMSLMQAGIFGVVHGIVDQRARGVLRRLFATPLSKADYLFAQVISRIIISIFQVFIFFFYAKAGNYLLAMMLDRAREDAPLYFTVVGSMWQLILAAVIGSVVFICFGFAFSSLAKNAESAMPIANLISMPMMFLSGTFWPREAMPDIVAKVADYFPLSFLIDALRGIMNRGFNLWELEKELIFLAIWALVTFFVTVRFFKWEVGE